MRENLNILRFLSLANPDDAAALAIRHAALTKWGLLAAAMVSLSALFFGRDHALLTAVGVLFLVTAAIGSAGLGCNRFLEQILPPLALALLATGGVATKVPVAGGLVVRDGDQGAGGRRVGSRGGEQGAGGRRVGYEGW